MCFSLISEIIHPRYSYSTTRSGVDYITDREYFRYSAKKGMEHLFYCMPSTPNQKQLEIITRL